MEKCRKKQKGATAIEYVLIVAGISLAIAGVVFLMGDNLLQLYSGIEDILPS